MSREKENQERSERWASFQNDPARARLILQLEETEGEFSELGPAKIIEKHFDTIRKAELFQDKLYSAFDSVHLIRSPMFSESGRYVWEVATNKEQTPC